MSKVTEVTQQPQHIAIVMDGNGRWAQKKRLPRIAGHRAGANAVDKVIRYCAQKQIPVLSLFAFSCENWQRPRAEVSFLMNLLHKTLGKELPALHQNNIRLRFIGKRSELDAGLVQAMQDAEQLTQDNSGMVLVIAVNYSGQWDMVQAAQNIVASMSQQHTALLKISDQLLAQNLSTAGLPNPDLFIRTSGEYRVSNFFLWQLAYAELYFSETMWPDFNEDDMEQALLAFAQRDRRFGNINEEDAASCS